MSVYERDRASHARAQGYRFHLDHWGEEALHACLPSHLYDLVLATRGQPSRGATRFTIVDGELREAGTQYFPEQGSSEFVTVGSSIDRLIYRHFEKLISIPGCVTRA